jgi:RNA polymerase primary sigma factor
MACRIIRTHSPFDQSRQARSIATTCKAGRSLSIADQALVRHILTTKYEYIANDVFALSDHQAERRVFDEAPEIERPDTSWYHPVMDYVAKHQQYLQRHSPVLLTAKQEHALFLQFNYCRMRVCRLRDQLEGQDPLDADAADALLIWYRKASQYRDQIAQTNLALVLAMAKRVHVREVDFPDLVSEGNMALLRAVDKFDVARGFKFSTYACRAILKAFSRTGVKASRYRALFPAVFDPTLEKSDHMDRKRAEHKADCVDELTTIIKDNRALLSDIESQVLKHRFALNKKPVNGQDPVPLTLKEVGRIIGVTKERVRQIQNKAMSKIRDAMLEGLLA